MKKFAKQLFLILLLVGLAAPAMAQSTTDESKKDYLIVVSNSTNKAANEKVLADVKDTFADAALYYDANTKQYYVYVERYYSKSGADYAAWWIKKEHKELPKVWAKEVPAGAK